MSRRSAGNVPIWMLEVRRRTFYSLCNSKGGRSFYTISYLLSNKEALNQPVFTDSTQVVLVTTDVDNELRLVLQLKLSADPLYDKNCSPHVGKYPPR